MAERIFQTNVRIKGENTAIKFIMQTPVANAALMSDGSTKLIGDVENTLDIDKPLSTAAINALATKFTKNGDLFGVKYNLGSKDNYSLGFITNNTERITIRNTGEIGIGTTTPSTTFHLYGDKQTLLIEQNPSINGPTTLALRAAGVASTSSIILENKYIWSQTNAPNNLYIGNTLITPQITIDGDGRLGIGTPNPVSKLHIYDNQTLGSTAGNNTLLTTLQQGGPGSNLFVKEWSSRGSAGSDWLTWNYVNGIDVGGAFNTPETCRTFWRRDPFTQIQYFGSSGNNTLSIQSAYGRVGVNVDTPQAALDVHTNSNDYSTTIQVRQNNPGTQALASIQFSHAACPTTPATIHLFNNGQLEINNLSIHPTFFRVNNRNSMLIDGNGRVGIDTYYPSAKLTVDGEVGQFMQSLQNKDEPSFSFKTYNGGSTVIDGSAPTFIQGLFYQEYYNTGINYYRGSSSTGGFMTFNVDNGTEAMRLATNGNVGIGSTSTSYPLHVVKQVSNVSIYASHDIVAYSDISVKRNIRQIENVLERVSKSRGVLYDRTDTGNKDNIGFIAQELEEQFPELVVENPDGTKAVKYQNATAVLFEAVKGLKTICDKQQIQIDELLKLIKHGITT